MFTSISREYWFSAAHRLERHPKCGRLHGHNYRVVVELYGVPDENGMVLDYGVLDKIVKPFIDEKLDHKYLISDDNNACDDPAAMVALENGWEYELKTPASTAEYIAKVIYENIQGLPNNITGIQVQVDETPKSTAVYPIYVE